MEIKNEIKQKDEEKKKFIHRNLADIQRAKLNKLMENPEKPMIIPENDRKKEYVAPSFIRNVMGSSAGAGSGEFHVYRHLRRKEYARQKNMLVQTERERLDQEFQDKLENNQKLADEKTNKKRQKRLKKKSKQKNKKPKLRDDKKSEEDDDDDEEVLSNGDDNDSDNKNGSNEDSTDDKKESNEEKKDDDEDEPPEEVEKIDCKQSEVKENADEISEVKEDI